jgi:hypothetical protein
MTVWVIRDGQLVVKGENRNGKPPLSFPCPMVSRFEAFESPITGETISSWRQRDADMEAGGAVDPRDLPTKPFEERKKQNARVSDASIWTDPV